MKKKCPFCVKETELEEITIIRKIPKEDIIHSTTENPTIVQTVYGCGCGAICVPEDKIN
jgi:hypothetical protein